MIKDFKVSRKVDTHNVRFIVDSATELAQLVGVAEMGDCAYVVGEGAVYCADSEGEFTAISGGGGGGSSSGLDPKFQFIIDGTSAEAMQIAEGKSQLLTIDGANASWDDFYNAWLAANPDITPSTGPGPEMGSLDIVVDILHNGASAYAEAMEHPVLGKVFMCGSDSGGRYAQFMFLGGLGGLSSQGLYERVNVVGKSLPFSNGGN